MVAVDDEDCDEESLNIASSSFSLGKAIDGISDFYGGSKEDHPMDEDCNSSSLSSFLLQISKK